MLAKIVNSDRSDVIGKHQIISHTAMFYVRHGKSHEFHPYLHPYLHSNETFCTRFPTKFRLLLLDVLISFEGSLYRVFHFNLARRIFQTLFSLEKNVSDKSCRVRRGTQDGELEFLMKVKLKVI